MTAIDKIISLAKSEIGYHEKASNANLDNKTANSGSANYTKYARDLDALTNFYNGPKNGFAWCDIWYDWLFYKTFGAAMAMRMLYQPERSAGAGCTYSLGYYKANNRFYSTPQVGDQIFFGTVSNSTHTGLVIEIKNGRVYTIEGNTSDGVYERNYILGASNIAGYGRPNWDLVGGSGVQSSQSSTPTPSTQTPSVSNKVGKAFTVTIHELSVGCTGPEVKNLQRILYARGCLAGNNPVDGEFGQNTRDALIKLQKQLFPSTPSEWDGAWGAKTALAAFTRLD